jgi:acetylglutamate kinase
MKLLVKLGGTLLESEDSRNSLALQLTALVDAGHRLVVVHGGGKRLSRYLATLDHESEFRNGLRVTPPETLDAVLRVLAGSVNHHLVAELQKAGAKAVGLSGIDAGLVRAVQMDPELGAVGKVESVDASLLELLTTQGYLPTVACIAGGDDGAIFNVNADQMAAGCARGFGVDRVIFLTDVGGVLDAEQVRIRTLTCGEAEELISSGVAQGGMEAKLRSAMAAVAGGIKSVSIVAGTEPDILARVLAGEDTGTTLLP